MLQKFNREFMQILRKLLGTEQPPLMINFATFAGLMFEMGCSQTLLKSEYEETHQYNRHDRILDKQLPISNTEVQSEQNLVREMW